MPSAPSIQRLLLVRLSAMGDVVHSLSALERARALWPQAELWWVAEHLAAPLLLGHPALTGVVVLERKQASRNPRALWRSLGGLRELRTRRFDAAIDLQGLLRSALVARASGARRVLGPSWAREGARFLYTDRLQVPRPADAHAVARYRLLVERSAEALDPSRAELDAAGTAAREAAPRLPPELQGERARSPLLVLLPGAGKPANRLPASLLASLVDACRSQIPSLEVVALGGPQDGARGREVQACASGKITLRCGGDLATSARLLASAWAVVGGDTGPLHLARALGTPTLGLFPAADPRRTSPGGIPGAAWSLTLPGEAACAPCVSKRCQRPARDRICLETYRPHALAALLLPHLRPPGTARP